MRARLVRPDFWDDSLVAQLPDSVRLFYIGLWCVADDAGYMEWDFAKIGAVLMPYRAVAARERLAAKYGAALVDADERVRVLECGKHAVIPSLVRHRIAGGNKSERTREAHERCRYVQVRTQSTDKSRSESLSPSSSESVSGRRGALVSPFGERMAANGLKGELVQ